MISDLYPPVAFGGYERQCAALVEGLRKRHEVTVLTSDRNSDRAPGSEFGVRRDLSYVAPLKREALKAPVKAAHAARLTRDILHDLRPDVVYVANCVGAPQAAPCTAMNAGYPVVFRLAELWYAATLLRGDRFLRHLHGRERGPRRAWAAAVRAVNRHPALRLAPDRPARVAISWCSNDLRARASVAPTMHPVLERTIYPGSAQGKVFMNLPRRPSARATIAYLGRVTVAKGAELACRALAVLRSAHGIDAQLLVAGHCAPAMRRRLEGLARELGVARDLRLLGPLDTAAIGELLQEAHAVVIPSVQHEAFGNVCIEAGLARVPIVASRIGGIPEALRDGEDALLFDPPDHEECAQALAATVNDPSRTETRVRNAYSRMQAFTVERYVAASEELLENAAVALG
jgi:glycosyltransferase involved in cell wall biosynthesis